MDCPCASECTKALGEYERNYLISLVVILALNLFYGFFAYLGYRRNEKDTGR